MHSAFNLFVYPNSMFTLLFLFCLFVFFICIFYERAMSSPEKQHLKITIIIIKLCRANGSVRNNGILRDFLNEYLT